MHTSAVVRPAPASPAPRALHRQQAFLAAIAVLIWWWLAFRDGAAFAAGARTSLAVGATLMVLSRLGASALEALAYALFWRTRGERLPYARFLVGLVALSLVDRLAQGLAGLARSDAALAPWLAPVAGLHLLRDRWPEVGPGVWSAFGGLGLLTLSRLLMTAWLQARALERRLRGPLLVTVAAWLLTRVAVWWAVDLFRGMSPVR